MSLFTLYFPAWIFRFIYIFPLQYFRVSFERYFTPLRFVFGSQPAPSHSMFCRMLPPRRCDKKVPFITPKGTIYHAMVPAERGRALHGTVIYIGMVYTVTAAAASVANAAATKATTAPPRRRHYRHRHRHRCHPYRYRWYRRSRRNHYRGGNVSCCAVT